MFADNDVNALVDHSRNERNLAGEAVEFEDGNAYIVNYEDYH